ncbi:MAG TPA: cyclic nucleotide-binding domain-containing protein [Anaerolineales bacterium]|nr:cyclic nucleotide-binding domain-containing protein [Anaerolineales bacterium]HUM28078.1 cyclic nucleotide-binding domain-containing protein [Anaerolineales bacterium]
MLDILPIIPLFQDLSPAETEQIKPLFESKSYPAGMVIFEQGDPATHLYLILEGAVSVRYKPYDGATMTLTRLRSGDVFGWSAVIGSAKFTSSIWSETQLEILRIHKNDLWDLVNTYPEFGKTIINRFARMVSPRWENAHAQIQLLLESNKVKTLGGQI